MKWLFSAQIVSLRSELGVLKGDLDRQTRNNQVLEGELQSLRSQLVAKEASLDEALQELHAQAGNQTWAGDDIADRRQHKIGRLNAEVSILMYIYIFFFIYLILFLFLTFILVIKHLFVYFEENRSMK